MIYLFDSAGECVRTYSFQHPDPEVQAEALARAMQDSGATQAVESRDVGAAQDVYLRDGAVLRRGAKPSEYHEWDWSEYAWVLPLEKAKAQRWAQAKAERDTVEFGPFVWNGYTFDGDDQSQRRLGLAVSAAQMALASEQGWSIDWTLEDNTVVSLSAADLIAVVEAMGANTNQAHEAARQKRAAIEAATSLAELDAL